MKKGIYVFIGAAISCFMGSYCEVSSAQDTGITNAIVFEIRGDKDLLTAYAKKYSDQMDPSGPLGTLEKLCHFDKVYHDPNPKIKRREFVFACTAVTESFSGAGEILLEVNSIGVAKSVDALLTMTATSVPCNQRKCPTDTTQGCTLYFSGGKYYCYHTGKLGQSGHECLY